MNCLVKESNNRSLKVFYSLELLDSVLHHVSLFTSQSKLWDENQACILSLEQITSFALQVGLENKPNN